MVCTRCHAREGATSPSPETRAKMEERFGAAWPFPDGVCWRCIGALVKNDPEVRARYREFQKKLNAKALAEAGAAVRTGVLKVLNWADLVAERLGAK